MYQAHVVSLMAGAEAEAECIGCCVNGDRHDREEIELLMLGAEGASMSVPLEMRLPRATRMLVRRHHDKTSASQRLCWMPERSRTMWRYARSRGRPMAPAVADVWVQVCMTRRRSISADGLSSLGHHGRLGSASTTTL